MCKSRYATTVQSGFVVYFGVQPQIANWSEDGCEFSVILNDNPLADFVEVPAEHKGLLFSSLVAGALKGALETVCVRLDSVLNHFRYKAVRVPGAVRVLHHVTRPC